ncbi:MAG: hypothetical protein CO118_09310 [Flavobacteriales bacterium CG_4_9_14_3_um_filter_32_8]|nr:MAG: hypothetical protein CO118_09310 [Flavobacteriales bacterium CG_4_9_14_3_um_filter_32_8]
MNLESLKIDLAKQLFSINEKSVLEQIKSILERKVIVAYSTDGKPLTVRAYNKALEKAEQDVVKGKLTDSVSLRKEVESWKSH